MLGFAWKFNFNEKENLFDRPETRLIKFIANSSYHGLETAEIY